MDRVVVDRQRLDPENGELDMTIVLAAPPGARYATAAAAIRDLPAAMRADRDRHSWTIRQQATLVGVGVDTLTRLEQGSNPTQATILACLDHLARA